VEGGVRRRAQVRLGLSGIAKYLRAVAGSIHPVRALFELCGTVVVAVPFVTAFFMNASGPLMLYLLYPCLFLVTHFVWFRLPFADRRIRWALFWFSLTGVVALGSGFLYRDFRSSAAASSAAAGGASVPAWMWPHVEVSFPKVAISFLIPSGLAALLYCYLLSLFLRAYRSFRREERARRAGEREPGTS
jgi:hypothetical protein